MVYQFRRLDPFFKKWEFDFNYFYRTLRRFAILNVNENVVPSLSLARSVTINFNRQHFRSNPRQLHTLRLWMYCTVYTYWEYNITTELMTSEGAYIIITYTIVVVCARKEREGIMRKENSLSSISLVKF